MRSRRPGGALSGIERLSRLLVVALILGSAVGLSLALSGVGVAIGLFPPPELRDWHAYYAAAERLREGAPLFPAVADPNAETTYRYSPWFAVAWIPLTLLPREAAGVVWVGLMYAAVAVALVPLLRSGRLPAQLLAALMLPFLVQAADQGNVHPLLVAALVHGVDGRWGPIAIGVAASLKGFPILYAGHYALRRQWGHCLASLLVAAALLAPFLLTDLTHYPLLAGPTGSLNLISPLAWLAGAAIGIAAAVRFARSPAGWFATSLAIVLAMPRLVLYDMSYLLVTGRELLGKVTKPERPRDRSPR
jgi:hypothetical protein